MSDNPLDMTGKVMFIIERDTYYEMKAQITSLEADNARLRETLAFAAQYKGFEARIEALEQENSLLRTALMDALRDDFEDDAQE